MSSNVSATETTMMSPGYQGHFHQICSTPHYKAEVNYNSNWANFHCNNLCKLRIMLKKKKKNQKVAQAPLRQSLGQCWHDHYMGVYLWAVVPGLSSLLYFTSMLNSNKSSFHVKYQVKLFELYNARENQLSWSSGISEVHCMYWCTSKREQWNKSLQKQAALQFRCWWQGGSGRTWPRSAL